MDYELHFRAYMNIIRCYLHSLSVKIKGLSWYHDLHLIPTPITFAKHGFTLYTAVYLVNPQLKPTIEAGLSCGVSNNRVYTDVAG